MADKEVVMSALNMKSMSFDGADIVKLREDITIMGEDDPEPNMVNLLLDLSFATNVRYLDEQEIYLSDNIELTKTLPFASGMAMARGLLDSLMSATYFNASALKLLRLIVTGGATIDLEKSLAEGAGLRGGYSTPETLANRDRCRMGQISLSDGPLAVFGEGRKYQDLFVAALRNYGMLCIGLYRWACQGSFTYYVSKG